MRHNSTSTAPSSLESIYDMTLPMDRETVVYYRGESFYVNAKPEREMRRLSQTPAPTASTQKR
ncbi:hypothetical protein LTS18_013794, partial [Coniosporium uncinatum]